MSEGKPKRTLEDERRRYLTGLSLDGIAAIVHRGQVALEMLDAIKGVCLKAEQDGVCLVPSGLAAWIAEHEAQLDLKTAVRVMQ